jgi:DNA-binding CsgD family transcriptional regulator
MDEVTPSPGMTLSRRETDVLRMAASGLTNAEIARGFGITVHTVKFHLASVYKKLGAANRTEAASLYLRQAARDVSEIG